MLPEVRHQERHEGGEEDLSRERLEDHEPAPECRQPMVDAAAGAGNSVSR